MLVLAFVPVFGMFLFLSLQHKCDGAVGFIFHKNLGRFLSQPKWELFGDMPFSLHRVARHHWTHWKR